MKIHKSDGRAIMGYDKGFGVKDHGFKCWRYIIFLVRDRAIERMETLAERNQWNRIQNAAQESWE